MPETTSHPIYRDPEFFETVLKACDALENRRLSEARDLAETAIETRPGSAESFFLMGVVAFLEQDFGRAASLLRLAQDIDGETSDYADALANLHARMGNLAESLYYAKLATVLTPHPVLSRSLLKGLQDYSLALAEARNVGFLDDAVRALDEGRYKDALDKLEAQRAIGKDDTETAYLTARALAALGAVEGAMVALLVALRTEPRSSLLMAAMGDLLAGRNDVAAARACMERALADAQTADDRDLALGTADGLAAADQPWPAYEAAVRAWVTEEPAVPPLETDRGEGPLRVGLLTDSAGDTQMGPFLEPLLRTPVDGVDLHLYSTSGLNDDWTQALRRTGVSWVDLAGIDLDTAGLIMEGDDLDALVDLTTTGLGRCPTLLRRVPVARRIAWLGLDTPLSRACLDFAVDDAETAAASALGGIDSKRLGSPLMAMTAPAVAPLTETAPGADGDGLSFGAIADPAFLTPSAVRLMADILVALPSARLVLGNLPQVHDETVLLTPFQYFGVGNRVFLALGEDEEADAPVGAEFYRHLDVLLDPPGRPRPRDVAEALWQGLPVVSLRGARRHDCLGASVLAAAGQSRWVAETDADYVAKAVEAALWAVETPASRGNLHAAVRQSALFRPGDMAVAFATLLKDDGTA
jgi:tetratricopeptide (TPR) repeat protein